MCSCSNSLVLFSWITEADEVTASKDNHEIAPNSLPDAFQVFKKWHGNWFEMFFFFSFSRRGKTITEVWLLGELHYDKLYTDNTVDSRSPDNIVYISQVFNSELKIVKNLSIYSLKYDLYYLYFNARKSFPCIFFIILISIYLSCSIKDI